ncbi:hypothetical protein [Rivularia sp. UHCC 0363]|uniref:hypothetical protein n=1 Tax=Rivularia sp. UHCC 0363 TaxID=3110244 RepID=UPI002B201572|nr:hypothetical protein [Rivularia sp. UHCC 0363]MEA5597033.1 hypothetical protein [Rivularia sp. UHCC 0363]
MLKRFFSVVLLGATSAVILAPAFNLIPAWTQVLAQTPELSNTQLPQKTVIQDVKPIKSEIKEVYQGFVSSDKLDLLRKQPESVLKSAGIRVPSQAKIEFSGETNVDQLQRRRVRITIIIFGDGTVIIIVRQ